MLLVACLLGMVLLSGCTKLTNEEKCITACNNIDLLDEIQGSYIVRGIWTEENQTCVCKTYIESKPTFKVKID
jgi:hypothetical protein